MTMLARIRRHRTALAAALCLLGVAACKPDTTPPDAVFAQPGVVFTLSPPQAPDCRPESLYQGTISWSLSGRGPTRLEIRVDSRGGPEFLSTSDPEGSQDTGEWIRPGMWFLLVDSASDTVLATLRAGPKPCPAAGASADAAT
ncbi:hypothetical protein ACFOEA_11515 [Coralloluteibacterium stylophorae]